MSINATAPKVLAYLRLANETARRLQDRLEKDAAAAKNIEEKVPEAVNALLENERIFGHQTQKVAEMISTSHEACIDLIRDLAKHRNSSELEAIGTPGTKEKRASAPHFAGARVADFDETEAGRIFREKLLGVH